MYKQQTCKKNKNKTLFYLVFVTDCANCYAEDIKKRNILHYRRMSSLFIVQLHGSTGPISDALYVLVEGKPAG